ncbi:hypothetical protein QQS21_002076 [Conoideocrella luteorostrata]|uniref:Uncharacterized protein n=1 Tax=Conoideocrella luteorostrata TaxID=1105319 RepID=A0AAJ0G1H9_9HYPO|nr:hypothetical protein QQS21_002076 [Conoideocrella luteorostrata]
MPSTHQSASIWIALYFVLWACLCDAAPVPGQGLGKLKDVLTKPKTPPYSSFTSDTYSDSEFNEAPRTEIHLPTPAAKTDMQPSVKFMSGKTFGPLRDSFRGVGDSLHGVKDSVRDSVRRLRTLPNGKQYKAGDQTALVDDDYVDSGERNLPNGKKYTNVNVDSKLPPGAVWNAHQLINGQGRVKSSIDEPNKIAGSSTSDPIYPKSFGTLADVLR